MAFEKMLYVIFLTLSFCHLLQSIHSLSNIIAFCALNNKIIKAFFFFSFIFTLNNFIFLNMFDFCIVSNKKHPNTLQ